MYIYICVYSAKPCSRETLAASSDTPALNRVGTGMLPLEHQKPKFHTKTLNANRKNQSLTLGPKGPKAL